MFAAARKVAENFSPSTQPDSDIVQVPLDSLPEQFTFAQISNELDVEHDVSSQEVAREKLLVLNSCLSYPERLQREDGDEQTISRIMSWTANSMLPDGRMILTGDMEEVSWAQPRIIQLVRHKGFLGLLSLKALLQSSIHNSSLEPNPNILTSITAFTSARDAWTSGASQYLAQKLLLSYASQVHSKEFIIGHVVQSFIRPLFSGSKPEAITSTGRKAMPSSAPPRRHDIAELEHASKPWKYECPYSVTVFSWAVDNASQEIITAHWNMFIPPLLTLLDISTTSILVRGLETLSSFLSKFSSKLLQQMGLGEVFEDAVMPKVLSLPSITSEKESIQILPAAFDVLFALVDVRYPDITPSSSTELSIAKTSSTNANTPDQKLAFMDRIMSKGVLTAYIHASNYPEITTLLLTALSTLFAKMGINCVKHLKDILPLLTQALTDPFAGSRPDGLLEGMKCLKNLILNAWPRMGLRDGGHGMEVVGMLVVCWKIVVDVEPDVASEDIHNKKRYQVLQEVKREIEVVGRLLVKSIQVVDSGVDVKEELRPLLDVDPSLGTIFGF